METRITKLLGIKYPVLMGGLQWIANAEFVASVSRAGGMGFIAAASFSTKEALVREIQRCRSLTDGPFGVNISMLPEKFDEELTMEFVEAVVEQGVKAVETSGRDPSPLIHPLKQAGVKVIHKVTAPRHGRKAEQAGADAIVLVGYEAAGHPGMQEVGTFVNLPAACAQVDIPIIAAGGVCDGSSMVAALALGAEGVMMGTRFVATQECPVHDNFKQWILNADISDTVIVQRSINNALRAIRNKQAATVLEMEQAGARLKELLPYISGRKGAGCLETGNLEDGLLTAGQCAGRIHRLMTVAELIAGMVEESQGIINKLAKI